MTLNVPRAAEISTNLRVRAKVLSTRGCSVYRLSAHTKPRTRSA